MNHTKKISLLCIIITICLNSAFAWDKTLNFKISIRNQAQFDGTVNLYDASSNINTSFIKSYCDKYNKEVKTNGGGEILFENNSGEYTMNIPMGKTVTVSFESCMSQYTTDSPWYDKAEAIAELLIAVVTSSIRTFTKMKAENLDKASFDGAVKCIKNAFRESTFYLPNYIIMHPNGDIGDVMITIPSNGEYVLNMVNSEAILSEASSTESSTIAFDFNQAYDCPAPKKSTSPRVISL